MLLTDEVGNYSVKIEEGIVEYRSGSLEEITEQLSEGEEFVVIGYSDWYFPSMKKKSSTLAILLALLGAYLVFLVDKKGKENLKNNEESH